MLLALPLTLSLLAQTGAAQTGANNTEKPRFEDEIVAFEAADRARFPLPGKVLFVGSSSIRLWTTLAEDFPGYDTLNRGFGGSWLADSVRLIDRIVIPYKPSAIVLYAGTNDLADHRSPETVVSDFIAISPAPSRWTLLKEMRMVNGEIRTYASKTPRLFFIDIAPLMVDAKGGPRPELFVADQLHMNEKGYAIWKDAVGKVLPRMVKARR